MRGPRFLQAPSEYDQLLVSSSSFCWPLELLVLLDLLHNLLREDTSQEINREVAVIEHLLEECLIEGAIEEVVSNNLGLDEALTLTLTIGGAQNIIDELDNGIDVLQQS